jgi:signal transduction histidine kinase
MRIDRRVRLGLVALFIVISGLVFAVTRPPAALSPLTPDGYRLAAGHDGPVMTFGAAAFSFSTSATPPTGGWRMHALPVLDLLGAARAVKVDPPTVWARFRFDRELLGTRPIAFHGALFREDFILYLNGAELYRSRGDTREPTFAWNQPLFLWLPPAMLHRGVNEVTVRIETVNPQRLGIGTVQIGPDRDVRSAFNREYFFIRIAPQIISGYVLILTIGALFFWLKRPRDRIFAWLSCLGTIFLLRNLLYFAVESPFAPGRFWVVTTDASFLLHAILFGFAACYFALPRQRLLQILLMMGCIAFVALRHVLNAYQVSELPAFMLTTPVTVTMLVLMFRACRQRPAFHNWLMLVAILCIVLFAYHDLVLAFDIGHSAGVFLVPYGELLIFASFDAALTSRSQAALVDVEDVNLKLEARVAKITDDLQRSEAARAELQVAQAVGGERDRIMREIHDGIGSSLLTALASARHRNESPETIATLTRSLTDLRVGVDSLEPVGGDAVALLANLRHRMERELRSAGITFGWKVDVCPPLAWLDPVGALHILRILQEAIGNAVSHSEDDHIEVRCRPHDHDARAGVLIEIADRGKGFLPASPSRGKGLVNMAARAEALNAAFWCRSAPDAGTVISIWLPLSR